MRVATAAGVICTVAALISCDPPPQHVRLATKPATSPPRQIDVRQAIDTLPGKEPSAVQIRLGSPSEMRRDSNGDEKWTYSNGYDSASKTTIPEITVIIKQGKVSEVTW